MTNRHKAARVRAIRWMKGLLVTGSVAASLVGTQLIAERDVAAAAPTTVLPTEARQGQVWQQAPSGQTLELSPVPTAAAPLRPVTRSRSSR